MLRHLLRVLPLRWMVSWSVFFFFSEMLIYAYSMIFYKLWLLKHQKTIYKQTGYARFFQAPSVIDEGMFHHLATQACHSDGFIFEAFPIWWACCSTQVVKNHQDPSSWKWRLCQSEVKSSLDILTSIRLENSSYDSNSGWQVVGERILKGLRTGKKVHERQIPHSKLIYLNARTYLSVAFLSTVVL